VQPLSINYRKVCLDLREEFSGEAFLLLLILSRFDDNVQHFTVALAYVSSTYLLLRFCGSRGSNETRDDSGLGLIAITYPAFCDPDSEKRREVLPHSFTASQHSLIKLIATAVAVVPGWPQLKIRIHSELLPRNGEGCSPR
jgi:hypothetical protein